MSSTWQIQNYQHEQVDLGAWDENTDEEEGEQWPSEELDEEEEYIDDAYGR